MTLSLNNDLLSHLKILRGSQSIKEFSKEDIIDVPVTAYRRYLNDYICLFVIMDRLHQSLKKENKVDEVAFLYDYSKGMFGFSLSYKSVDLGDVEFTNFKSLKSGFLKFKQCQPLRRIIMNNPQGIEEVLILDELRVSLNQALSFANTNKKSIEDSLELYERKIYNDLIPIFIVKKETMDFLKSVEYVSMYMTPEKVNIYNKVSLNYPAVKDKLILESDLLGYSLGVGYNKKSFRI